jgi:hypothetical protein
MLRGLGPDLTAGGRRSEVACAIFYSEILGSKKEGARFAGGAEVEVGAAGEQSGAGGFAAAAGGAGRGGDQGRRSQCRCAHCASARCVLHLSRLCWANTWQWEGDMGREITGVRCMLGMESVQNIFGGCLQRN